MSSPKIQELQNILDTDIENTKKYIDRNAQFIKELGKKISEYLGCEEKDILVLHPGGGKPPLSSIYLRHFVTFAPDAKGEFRVDLVIVIKNQKYNDFITNNKLEGAYEKLKPKNEMIIPILITQKPDSFVVKLKTKGIVSHQYTPIEIDYNNNDESWSKLLTFFFENLKESLGSLEERINSSTGQS
ncbi:hypothetical protein I8748_14880 [Nostoc sp. CENA67]|uniref:Uncharacterized protein n=1 Tax=Amazonocrinis nigriterrae CENA67 TaxID=2794033 RepID=A0A8J7L8K3_9NOST|nr:hypothetical protein [Amazonocrinis nigriterrae]MBH8563453.1 hypothetical protein [Amazonocrinis nigriterrae CENA67]